MEGCDAVISCLGIGASYLTKLHNPDKIYSRAIAPITAAMRRAKVDRIICMTGWYTEGMCNYINTGVCGTTWNTEGMCDCVTIAEKSHRTVIVMLTILSTCYSA